MCHRIFWLRRLIQRRHLVTDRFFNFKLFASWKYGQLNAGEFLTQITLWLTLGLPSPPLSPTACVLPAPAWAHTGMPCWRAARDLSCQEEERRGVLQRPPQPFFVAGVGIDVEKKIALVMLRHVRVKCFVKLCDFLILEMPKQVQRKLAIFKNWLKRFSCSASNSRVHQWKVSHGFPSCRQRTQATGGKGKWWGKELLRYLLCSWAGGTTVALPWRESKDTGCWFPQLHRNEEIHKAFLKDCICGLAPLSALFHLRSPHPLPTLGKHCISGCEALVCI